MRSLTLKQQKFVDAYLRCGNATQAAIAAGYSLKTARSIASENLSKPAVQKALHERRDAQVEELQAHAQQYLQQLGRICDASIENIYDNNLRLRHPKHWGPDAHLIVEEFTLRQRKNGRTSVAVKLVDRFKFMEMIGNAVGAFTRVRYRKRKR